MKRQTIKNCARTGLVAVLAFVLVGVASPAITHAQTTAVYQPRSIQEQIAYLFGVISQLQMQLAAMRGGNVVSDDGFVYTDRDRRHDVEVETGSARDIDDDEAELRGSVDMDGADYVRVWFEYGEDGDLDERSRTLRIENRGDDTRSFSRTIDDLDEDERYYFRAVAEDPSGHRDYGRIRSFETDDNGRSSRHDDDFDLDVDDTTIDEGDRVTVDWEIPNDEIGSNNWIGLFEVGDSNNDYIDWVYIDEDDDGSETFRIDEEGEYEFRLFLDNSYDDEVTSDEVEVRD